MKTGTQEYISDRLLAAGGTLIRFYAEGSGPVTVPAEENGYRLNVLGSGSVIANEALTLAVAEGYTHLCRSCFKIGAIHRLDLPASLRSAVLPLTVTGVKIPEIRLKRSLAAPVRSILFQGSLPAGGGRHLVSAERFGLPGLTPLQLLVEGAADSMLPRYGPEMEFIFLRQTDDTTIFETLPCLDLSGRTSETEEYAAVIRMIREGKTGYRDAEAESRNDRLLHEDQSVRSLRQKRLCCVLAEDPSCLQITSALMFAPALYRIPFEGRDWYLYSRQHLTGDPGLPYLREDMCLFNSDGLVTDGALSDKIYSKIRLIMRL